MATRCNIVIERGDETAYLYHHYDGMPERVGAELEKFLAQTSNSQMTPNSVYKGLRYLYGDGYELSDGIHGDIEYLYTIKIEPSLQEVSLRCDEVSVDWTSMSMFHTNTTFAKKYERVFPFVDRKSNNGMYTKGDLKDMCVRLRCDIEVPVVGSVVYNECPDEIVIDEKRLKRMLIDALSGEIIANTKIEIKK